MTPLVEMRDIELSFGGVRAVDRVSVDLYPGEVVGLLGHNGAGKSSADQDAVRRLADATGDIRIDGAAGRIRTPRDARRHSIETIHQSLALAENLTPPATSFWAASC